MNKISIIGNLTRDPELRSTPNGISVCSFTVAVNKRKTEKNPNPEPDYFRVTAWRQMGENCGKFLQKGRKVCVVGSVSVSTYTGQDGKTRATLEVLADDVEFLSTAHDQAKESGIMPDDTPKDEQTGMEIAEDSDLPF